MEKGGLNTWERVRERGRETGRGRRGEGGEGRGGEERGGEGEKEKKWGKGRVNRSGHVK